MDWLEQLRIDVDRLNHYEKTGDTEKVDEYKDLIVSHTKKMLAEAE